MKEIAIAPHEDMSRGYFQLGSEVEDGHVEGKFFGKIGDLTDALFMATLINEMDSVVFIVSPEDMYFFRAWIEKALPLSDEEMED